MTTRNEYLQAKTATPAVTRRNMQLISASHPINLRGKYTFFVDIVLDRRRNEYVCSFPSEGLVVLETRGSSKGDALNFMTQKLARDPVGWIRKGNNAITELTEMINASQEAAKEEAPSEEEDAERGAPEGSPSYTEYGDPGDEHVERRVVV